MRAVDRHFGNEVLFSALTKAHATKHVFGAELYVRIAFRLREGLRKPRYARVDVVNRDTLKGVGHHTRGLLDLGTAFTTGPPLKGRPH